MWREVRSCHGIAAMVSFGQEAYIFLSILPAAFLTHKSEMSFCDLGFCPTELQPGPS
jgi:hypothetical protein